jgi:DNA-binding response OmpR family regulator
MRELISRAQAILRRREIDRTPRQTRRVGNLELDLLQHEVRVEGRRVRLTPTEFRILEILASEDRAWQRHELLAAAWGTSVVPDDRSCNVHVAHLRQKIEDDPTSPARIVTVRGVGYRLTR